MDIDNIILCLRYSQTFEAFVESFNALCPMESFEAEITDDEDKVIVINWIGEYEAIYIGSLDPLVADLGRGGVEQNHHTVAKAIMDLYNPKEL
ncbi:MAG: hypothetical protein OEY01_03740 [Desulfobulbaceae bacterium]|nr:hypothetical protein [Desulfobulbaceae bacterium]